MPLAQREIIAQHQRGPLIRIGGGAAEGQSTWLIGEPAFATSGR
jgi:hypothetical protein